MSKEEKHVLKKQLCKRRMITFNGAKKQVAAVFLVKLGHVLNAEIDLILEFHSHNGLVPFHFIIKGRFVERGISPCIIFCLCSTVLGTNASHTVYLILKLLHV